MVSEDGHAVQVLISLGARPRTSYLDNYDEVEPTLEADGLDTDLAGPFAVYADVNESTSARTCARAETISLPDRRCCWRC